MAVRMYLLSENTRWSCSEFSGWVSAIGEPLRQSGVSTGDRIAIVAENSPEMVALLWGIWLAGAVAAPLNVRLPEAQLRQITRETGAAKIFTSTTFKFKSNSNLTNLTIEPFLHNLPSVSENWDMGEWLSFPAKLAQDATLIFTSGSSGKPKAALHTFGNHYYNALGSNKNIHFESGDVWLLNLPLYHVGGMAILFRAAVSGGAVAVPGKNTSIADAVEKMGVTHVSLVATQLFRLLKVARERQALRTLKAVLLGGSAIPPALIEAALAENIPIYTSYGSTEMASQITTTPPSAGLDALKSSGKLLEYRNLKIANDGEILVKGETLFRGYWSDDRLDPARDAEGWFATGDLGRLDTRGYLYLTGRKDNMFISGGENIQPEEIETALNAFPGMRQSIVVPVANAEFGMRPTAFLDIDPWPDAAELCDFLAKRLAKFKIPDTFFPWPGEVAQSGIKMSRDIFRALAEKK